MNCNYINHSGGAVGADIQWDVLGRQYNIYTKHYYVDGYKTPFGNTIIDKDLSKQADIKLIKVNNQVLHRTFPTSNMYVNYLLRRNF